MIAGALELISDWLGQRLSPEPSVWLTGQIEKLFAAPTERNVALALGMVPRRLGRADLHLSAADLAEAARMREGWRPINWSVDVAARVLLLAVSATRLNDFPERFSSFCRYGDVAEQIACYSALPLLGDPAALELQVGEGLRTNMRAVFEAIAHNNPYPAEQFDEHRWNHMVLKAVFIGSRLSPIIGLDCRANPELARILCDYSHERWAAGRPVTPELWRCVGPFARNALVDDLARALRDDDDLARKGAALALSMSPHPRARTLLGERPGFADAIGNGTLTWDTLAHEIANRY